jgi:hypothetical protein
MKLKSPRQPHALSFFSIVLIYVGILMQDVRAETAFTVDPEKINAITQKAVLDAHPEYSSRKDHYSDIRVLGVTCLATESPPGTDVP